MVLHCTVSQAILGVKMVFPNSVYLALCCFAAIVFSGCRGATVRGVKFAQDFQTFDRKMAGDAVMTYNDVSAMTCAARCASKYPCGGFTYSAKDRVCMVCGLCGNFTMMDAPGYRLYTMTSLVQTPQTQASICPGNMVTPQKCWKLASGQFAQVSIGRVGSWAITAGGLIYYRAGTYQNPYSLGSTWTAVAGNLLQIDVGGVTTWGRNVHSVYYYRRDVASSLPAGSAWFGHFEDIRLKWISVSPGGSVWGRNTAGRAVHRQQSAWQDMGMDIQRVDAGVAGVWVLNTSGHLFHRLGTYGDSGSAAGTGWRALQGTFLSVACGRDLVVGVDLAGQVWLRTGLGPDTPTGLAWVPYPGSMKQVDVFQTDQGVALWGVDASGNTYFSLLKD